MYGNTDDKTNPFLMSNPPIFQSPGASAGAFGAFAAAAAESLKPYAKGFGEQTTGSWFP